MDMTVNQRGRWFEPNSGAIRKPLGESFVFEKAAQGSSVAGVNGGRITS